MGAARITAGVAALDRLAQPNPDSCKQKKINLKTDLTAPECEWLREVCNFTQEERQVFDLRVRDESIVSIGMKLMMSERTVVRRLCGIKKKIYKVI